MNIILGTFNIIDPDINQTQTVKILNISPSNEKQILEIENNVLKTFGNFSFDYESQQNYTIVFTVTDNSKFSLTDEFSINLQINDQNEVPSKILLSNYQIEENSPNETVVGTLLGFDPDNKNEMTQSLTFSLAYDDLVAFEIIGNELKIKDNRNINFEKLQQAKIIISISDNATVPQSLDVEFILEITDVNECPENIFLSNTILAFDAINGTEIGNISFNVSDINQAYTFLLSKVEPINYTDFFEINDLGQIYKRTSDNITDSILILSVTLLKTGTTMCSSNGSFVLEIVTEVLYPYSCNIMFNETSSQINGIPEDVQTGSVVATMVTVLDGGIEVDSIIPNDIETNQFFILLNLNCLTKEGLETCSIDLILNKSLDYETKSQLHVNFLLAAKDGSKTNLHHIINIVDINENPTNIISFPSTIYIPENLPPSTIICQFKVLDPDESDFWYYEILSDSRELVILNNSLLLTTSINFDYEIDKEFTFQIKIKDKGGLSLEKNFTIHILDINEAPKILTPNTVKIYENATKDQLIIEFEVDDPETTQEHTFEIIKNFRGNFKIFQNQLLLNIDDMVCSEHNQSCGLNFESDPTNFNISILVTDSGISPLSVIFSISFTLLDSNDYPLLIVFNQFLLEETAEIGSVIGKLNVIDEDLQDYHHCFVLPNTNFEIDNDIYLILVKPVDYETQNNYSVFINCSDTYNQSIGKTFEIYVTDVNEIPKKVSTHYKESSLMLTIQENPIFNQIIGYIYSFDEDINDFLDVNCNSTSIICKNMNCKSDITYGTVCEATINVIKLEDFNFEQNPAILFSVSVTDRSKNTIYATIIINITNIDENAVAILLNSSNERNIEVIENSKDVFIGGLTVLDPDEEDEYNFTIQEDVSMSFEIRNGTQLWISSNATIDFEVESQFSIYLEALQEDEIKINVLFFIYVTDINEAPTLMFLSKTTVLEDTLPQTTIAILTTVDPDNLQNQQTFTYNLLNFTSVFQINDGQLMLHDNVKLDYEKTASYSMMVEVTDSGVPQRSGTFEITLSVENVNEKPENLTLSENTIDENHSIGTLIGLLKADDQDNGNLIFKLNPNETNFIIHNNLLLSGKIFDYEIINNYQVDIIVTDNGSPELNETKSFTIFVNNVNERPIIIIKNLEGLETNTLLIPENNNNSTVIGTLYINDPDNDGSILCSIYPEMKEFFLKDMMVDPNNKIYSIISQFPFNYESIKEFIIQFNASDSGDLTDTSLIIVQVSDVNEPPYNLTIHGMNTSTIFINENSVGPQFILSLTVEDPDREDNHNFYIDNCKNCEGKFEFIGNQSRLFLVKGEYFDYEKMKDIDIEITMKAVDSGNLFITRTIEIIIVNINDAPFIQGLNFTSIPSYFENNFIFGSIQVTDDDEQNLNKSNVLCKLHWDNAWMEVVVINNIQFLQSKETKYLNDSSLTLKIECFDIEMPSLSSFINVALEINDIGNEPTILVYQNFTSQVNENERNIVLGQLFLQTQISNKTINFTSSDIIAKWPSNMNISLEDNGTVILMSPVDYELTNSFEMSFTMTKDLIKNHVQSEVNVVNINEAPTAIGFSTGNFTILKSGKSGIKIGTVVVLDEDEDQLHMFRIVNIFGLVKKSGELSKIDLSNLYMDDNKLYTLIPLSSLSKLYITINCTDNGFPPLSIESVMKVIIQVNEPPTAILFSGFNLSIYENVHINKTISKFEVQDPDIDDNHTCRSSNDQIKISNFSILINKNINYEENKIIKANITCEDDGGLSLTVLWSVIVEDVEEAPENAMINHLQWDEYVNLNSLIANITAIDPEGTECHYELIICEKIICPFTIMDNGSIFLNQSLTEITSTDEVFFRINVYDGKNNTNDFRLNTTIIRHVLPSISIIVKNAVNVLENTLPGSTIFEVEVECLTICLTEIYCTISTQGDFVTMKGFNANLQKSLDFESLDTLTINVTCWKNPYQMLKWVNVLLNVTDIDEPIKEIILNLTKSLFEGIYNNEKIGNIIIKDPENDVNNVKCYGVNGNLSIIPEAMNHNPKILLYNVYISGEFNYEDLLFGLNFSIACKDNVSSIMKNISLIIENQNDPPSQLLCEGSSIIDLDTLQDLDAVATLSVIDEDIMQIHSILIIGPCEKYFEITKNHELKVKNLKYCWAGYFNCSFLVIDNGIPPLTATFNKTFNFIKSNGEIRLNTSTIDIFSKANTAIASIQFISNFTFVDLQFRLKNTPDEAFFINKTEIFLNKNADQIQYQKVNLQILVFNGSDSNQIAEANLRLEITGFSVCQSSLNNCDENSTCELTGNTTDFNCICKEGYFESNGTCLEVNDCDSHPCIGNNSVCVDFLQSFQCQCEPNRSGRNCEIVQNNICNNIACIHGICSNDTCICSSGWQGQDCSESVDDCLEDSCYNNGLCVDQYMGFICECYPNFGGLFCEFNSSSCQNCQNEDDCISIIGNQTYCLKPTDKIYINFTSSITSMQGLSYFKTMFIRFLGLIPNYKNTTNYVNLNKLDINMYTLSVASLDQFGIPATNSSSWSLMKESCDIIQLSPEGQVCAEVFTSTNLTTSIQKSSSISIFYSNFLILIMIPILMF